MQRLLLTLFSVVCGENPRHIWSPGGQPLPCCERCTGLYAAAAIAVTLHLWFRPAITKRFLEAHALCLLQLGLFVFPWLPQWAALRTISGSLFGFGVVAFLWPAIADWHPLQRRVRARGLQDDQCRIGARGLQDDARIATPCRPGPLTGRALKQVVKMSRFSTGAYATGLAACLGLIPAIAQWGGRMGAFILVCLIVAGAIALAALASANLVCSLLALRVPAGTTVKTAEQPGQAAHPRTGGAV